MCARDRSFLHPNLNRRHVEAIRARDQDLRTCRLTVFKIECLLFFYKRYIYNPAAESELIIYLIFIKAVLDFSFENEFHLKHHFK